MTSHDIFTCKIKYAKVCTGIYAANGSNKRSISLDGQGLLELVKVPGTPKYRPTWKHLEIKSEWSKSKFAQPDLCLLPVSE